MDGRGSAVVEFTVPHGFVGVDLFDFVPRSTDLLVVSSCRRERKPNVSQFCVHFGRRALIGCREAYAVAIWIGETAEHNTMNLLRIFSATSLMAICSTHAAEPACIANVSVEPSRPNVVLILADDLGYADIGCFGSEIETPNVDRLAKEGLQFSHFRATPMCVTSRIALMSGMPMHRAGNHNYSHSVPLAQLLKKAGYRTMMTGKWHGGSPDPQSPDLFDRSFGFLGGATDSFAGGKDWFLDDQSFNAFDKDFYSTHAFADRSIKFMQEAVEHQQPFFMYVAFNAPHHPCQAPKRTVEKYMKTYRRGYEVLRTERRKKQLSLGLVDPVWNVATIGNEVRRWKELTLHRQEVETQKMAAYAAAVDEVDQSIGRMLAYLDNADLSDNTLVIFLSDNGGDYNNGGINSDEKQVPWLPRTNPTSSNGWASVKCAPFRYYKHSCHEGGIATPMVLRWPEGIQQRPGKMISSPTSITDIYPTLAAIADVAIPTEVDGHFKRQPTGRSLLPLFQLNGTRQTPPLFQWYAFSRAWIQDEWKAVRLYGGPWQLFDLRTDRGEANDLAVEHPEMLAGFIGKWEDFATEADVPNLALKAIETQRGWGWHRLEMSCPSLTAVEPDNGAITGSTSVELKLSFDQPISFVDSPDRSISLYRVADESSPVWQFDPDANHNAEGKLTVSFTDVPTLRPNTHYCVRWDPGWVKLGGQPIGPLNDGAYWWRFRTPAATVHDK